MRPANGDLWSKGARPPEIKRTRDSRTTPKDSQWPKKTSIRRPTWAKYAAKTHHRSKGNAQSDTPVNLKIEYSFFHSKGEELMPISVDQLFQGYAGIAACSFEDGF